MDDFIFMAELESDLRDEYMMNPPKNYFITLRKLNDIDLIELKEAEIYEFLYPLYEKIQLF